MSKSTWRLNKLQKYKKSNLWQLDVFYNRTSNKSFNFYDMLSFCYIYFSSAQSLFWLCDPLHNQQYIRMSIIVSPNLQFIFFSLFVFHPKRDCISQQYASQYPTHIYPLYMRSWSLPCPLCLYIVVTGISSKSWNCSSFPSIIYFQMHPRHYQALPVC